MEIKRAKILALDLMQYHGLVAWAFKFDRSVTRLGLCDYGNKVISLGHYATSVNSEDQVLSTILHEIAHALVGAHEGHGPVWRAKAIELGHSGNRCGNITVKAPAKYFIFCGECKVSWNLYRKSKRYNNIRSMWCRSCGKQKSFGKLVFLEQVK